jgi:hypothetical protein
MEHSLCVAAAKLANEDPIATAYPIETYILMECPIPWASQALESPSIPDGLRETITRITRHYPLVKALLINRDSTRFSRDRHIIIYQRQRREFSNKFDRYEFIVEKLEDATDVIENFFKGIFLRRILIQNVQDILICTHGSRDQCCARHGNPFYAEAKKLVRNTGQFQQVWRSSHFGGHRFVPTAITFPDGRYYARLDAFSFNAILRRSGDIRLILPIYRGSSLLPEVIQELERSLLLQYGWDWLGFELNVQMQSLDVCNANGGVLAHLQWKDRSQNIMTCQAQIVPDLTRTVTLQASCHAASESTYIKYNVKSIHISRSMAVIAS